MRDFLSMGGHGVYVWSAYAITLVVIVLNVWLARASHARSLERAKTAPSTSEPARKPTVRQLQ